jgi:hypothetical protein
MNKASVIVISIMLSACASTESDDNLASNDRDMVCEYVAKTGSNLKRKTCMTRELSEQLRKENDADLKEAWRKGQTSAGSTM